MNEPFAKYSHAAMACVFEIIFSAKPSVYLRQAARAAFDELDRLEKELSRFVPSSDIARINALAPGQSVHLGPDTQACLRLAEKCRRQTQGAFDVSASARVRADLGGIGKGYALDRMTDLLADWETGPALLQAGQSTARAAGADRLVKTWTVKLRDPARQRLTAGWGRIERGAISGSGTALHGAHILNPRTGRAGAVRTAAWAAAPTAAQADAFSTAFMILPAAAVQRVCRKCRGTAAVLATERGFRRLGRAPGVAFSFRRRGRGTVE